MEIRIMATSKKPSNAPIRTLEKQALERALQQAKPRTGYPYDWLDYEDYKSDPHSHSSVSTDETSNEDPNKSSEEKGERR